MSIIPASRLSASDLARLGNNFSDRGRRSYARRSRTPVYSGELAAVNRSLAFLGEKVGRLRAISPRTPAARA